MREVVGPGAAEVERVVVVGTEAEAEAVEAVMQVAVEDEEAASTAMAAHSRLSPPSGRSSKTRTVPHVLPHSDCCTT